MKNDESMGKQKMPSSEENKFEAFSLENRSKICSQEAEDNEFSSESDNKMLGFDAGPIERLSLFNVLNNIGNRLEKLEASIYNQDEPKRKSFTAFFLELSRIVFGGWTAFGFLFLLLFYSPLSKALSSIPDKVRSANEISLPGVSLKSTIERVATVQGLGKLAETIPNLSSSAIELLLKAPKQGESLISYTSSDDNQEVIILYLPSDNMLARLTELHESGLIEIYAGFKTAELIDTGRLVETIDDFKQQLPGTEEDGYRDERIRWVLTNPLPRDPDFTPSMTWELSDSGDQAVSVILKAVTQELVQSEEAEID